MNHGASSCLPRNSQNPASTQNSLHGKQNPENTCGEITLPSHFKGSSCPLEGAGPGLIETPSENAENRLLEDDGSRADCLALLAWCRGAAGWGGQHIPSPSPFLTPCLAGREAPPQSSQLPRLQQLFQICVRKCILRMLLVIAVSRSLGIVNCMSPS